MSSKYSSLLESIIMGESFKVATDKFSEVVSKEEVKLYIDKFKDLSKRNIIQGQDKDISLWIKRGWEEFKEFVDGMSTKTTKKDIKKKRAVDSSEAITLYSDDDVTILIPITERASCHYGKSTSWCVSVVSSKNRLYSYFSKGSFPIHIITNDSIHSIVWNIDSETITETRDAENNEVSMFIIDKLIPGGHESLIPLIKKNNFTLTKLSHKFKLHSADTAWQYYNRTGDDSKEVKQKIGENWMTTLLYIRVNREKRFEEGEDSLFDAIKNDEMSVLSDRSGTDHYIKHYLQTHFVTQKNDLPPSFTLEDLYKYNPHLAVDYIIQGMKDNLTDEVQEVMLNHHFSNSDFFIDFSGRHTKDALLTYVNMLYRKSPEEAKSFLAKAKKTQKGDLKDAVSTYIKTATNVNDPFHKVLIDTWGITGNGILDIIKNGRDSESYKIFDIVPFSALSTKSQDILLAVDSRISEYKDK